MKIFHFMKKMIFKKYFKMKWILNNSRTITMIIGGIISFFLSRHIYLTNESCEKYNAFPAFIMFMCCFGLIALGLIDTRNSTSDYNNL